MWDPYAEFQSATLPNGLTVHAAYWPGRPWEAMGFVIHSGAEYDQVGLEGLSHFVEHLVSSNTIIPRNEVTEFFEDCGGIVKLGTTGYPYTSYNFFVPIDKIILSRAFLIFGHMLLLAKLENFIERERQVIVGEFHRHYPNKFKFDLAMRKNKALYSGCWLERFVRPLGNAESVERITREELQAYYDNNYTPANMSVVGVGGVTLSELIELLSKSPFATEKRGRRAPLPDPENNTDSPLETRYVFETSKYVTTAVPAEVGGYQSFSKIPGNIDKQAIRALYKMLNIVLQEEVRERRAWAYAIDSSYFNFRRFYEFSISCNALATKALEEIEDVIEDCIASMRNREDLFEHVKRRAFAKKLMIDQNGKSICDGALYSIIEERRIVSLTENINDIERLTMDDIRNLLKWLRPERRWTLITQP